MLDRGLLEPLKRRALCRTTPLIDRVLVLLSLACHHSTVVFDGSPQKPREMNCAIALVMILAVGSAAAADLCVKTGWTTVARTGLTYGSGVWGQLKGFSGKSIALNVPADAALPAVKAQDLTIAALSGAKPATAQEAGALQMPYDTKLAAAYSPSPDIPTWHTVGGKTYMINHFEDPQPATEYVSELAQDAQGNVRMVDTRAVPDANVGGQWFTCSGSKTPWNTHLGSEEYPADCRVYEQTFLACKAGTVEASQTVCGYGDDGDGSALMQFGRYFGFYADAALSGLPESVDPLASPAAHAAFVGRFNCYQYGWTPETSVLAGGKTSVKKWYTLGRVSHEEALVMPDQKTVYTSDDYPSGVLLRFVADKAADLSSGTLYAAKFSSQTVDAATKQPRWTVSWIKLGSSTQSALEKIVASRPKFSDIFETAKPAGAPLKCPAGFLPANTVHSLLAVKDAAGGKFAMECLKVKPGMDTAAAFLESRRYASIKGATTEWEKMEGMALAPRYKQLYVSLSKVRNGMLDNAKGGQYDYAGSNDVKLETNACGIVVALDYDATYAVTSASVLLGGKKNADANDANNACDLSSIAEPDNLHYIAGNLIINEDTSQHQNNVAWAYNLESGSLTRIVSAPQKAEISGIYDFTVGAYSYLTMAFQHPGDLEGAAVGYSKAQIDAQRGYMGYIGPLPADFAISDKYTLKFAPIGVAKAAQVDGVLATNQVCALPANPKIVKGKASMA